MKFSNSPHFKWFSVDRNVVENNFNLIIRSIPYPHAYIYSKIVSVVPSLSSIFLAESTAISCRESSFLYSRKIITCVSYIVGLKNCSIVAISASFPIHTRGVFPLRHTYVVRHNDFTRTNSELNKMIIISGHWVNRKLYIG